MTRLALLPFILLLAACASTYDPWLQTADYGLEMRVDLAELEQTGASKDVRLWLPKPTQDESQQVLEYVVESPWPYIETEDEHGNQFLYVEKPDTAQGAAGQLVVKFKIRRTPTKIHPGDEGKAARYMGPLTKVPIGGTIADASDRVMEGHKSDGERIKAAYDYVVSSMRYDKQTPGWGEGDAVRALDVKAGNCTDFHSLFMGLTRSQSIASRFVMGYPIPSDKASGQITGYHCWSEAYDRQNGWVPVDASEAAKAGTPERFYAFLPSDRVAFTMGRDLALVPAQLGPRLNFFIAPYAEVDGSPHAPPWTLRYDRLAVGRP
jgi:transglutaminase-like putative cysteine protease